MAAKIYKIAAEKITWRNRYTRKRYIKTAEYADFSGPKRNRYSAAFFIRRFSHIAANLIDKSIHTQPNILHEIDTNWDQHPPSILIDECLCQQIHNSDVVRYYFYARFYNGLDDRAHLIHLRVSRICRLFLLKKLFP